MIGDGVETGGPRVHYDERGSQFDNRPTNPQIQNGELFLEVGSPNQNRDGPLQITDETAARCGRQELGIEGITHRGVEVRRSDGVAHQSLECQSLLIRAAGAAEPGDYALAARIDDRRQTVGGVIQRITPRRLVQTSVFAADERRRQPVGGCKVLKPESALVAEPALICGFDVHAEQTEDLVLAGLHRYPTADGTTGANTLHRFEVPRPCPEPIRGGGQCADRADLDRVTREVGGKRFVWKGVHLRVVATIEEFNQRISRDLIAESHASGTQDAALAVEHHQIADRDGLLEVPLLLDITALARAKGHRLVLERALAAAVAHRTVERMVDQE